MNIIKTFSDNNKSIDVYGSFENPLFHAKKLGHMLGFVNIRQTLSRMDDDYKQVKKCDSLGGAQKMTFLTEAGLYYLLMRSNKEECKPFQKWVLNDVLPSIRKTGAYNYDMDHTFRECLTFKIENENDLHIKVVNFIKKRFPHSLFTATLGENQDTSEKRLDSYKKGYLKGSPDIVINNLHKHYTGFAIEFKSPKGTGDIKYEQTKILTQYENNGFKVLVSNDYDHIIEELLHYFKDTRIKCKHCSGRFKSAITLKKHLIKFHKIKNV